VLEDRQAGQAREHGRDDVDAADAVGRDELAVAAKRDDRGADRDQADDRVDDAERGESAWNAPYSWL
jgi:hypothetical protein